MDNMESRNYFQSYADIQIHKLMLEDCPRNQAYRAAVLKNADYIKGKTVLDVGAGTGILSVFFAQAGARKVYAVEASDIYKICQEIIEENGLSDIITVIPAKIENVHLPSDEKVDIIVSEWMGFYLLHEGMLDSIIYARDRFLKPGGKLFPEIATLYTAPCCLPNLNEDWTDVEGIKMTSFATHLRAECAQKPEVVLIKHNQLLAEPEAILWLNLNTLTLDDLRLIKFQHVFAASKIGSYQGIALWFTCTFPSTSDEIVTLSTDPESDPTHWKQTVIVLPADIQLEKDQPIAYELNLSRSDENPRKYNIQVTMLDPDEVEHPECCQCYKTKCILVRTLIQKYNEDVDDE